jgi:1,4-dihydroxy-6-naphthoate synthase
MKFTLGFSPCPNDTFIFDALVNHKINTRGIQFIPVLEDVQTLNNWALEKKLDISKISYGVWPLLLDEYALLDAGGALGKGVGPLLIAKRPMDEQAINEARIAVPGVNTTANLLFSLAYPEAIDKKFMIFSDIEEAVLDGRADCGVIIHENRFTYMQRGLVKLADLGEYWEARTHAPIPLGGIVAQRSIPPEMQQEISELIKKSVSYAMSRYPALPDYVRAHAREMEEPVMRQHIDLYVNDYSLSLGEEGNKAVQTLLDVYQDMHLAQL